MIDDSIVKRVKESTKKYSFLKGKEELARSTMENLEAEIEELEKDSNELGKVMKVLGMLVDNMVQKDLAAIDHLVNYGLKVVFPDRDLSFQSKMVEMSGKMKLDFETFDQGKKADNDTHGSVSTVQSLILRIICMAKSGVARLLMLDETFAALDDDYIIRVGILLRELSEKMEMDILLATFNASVADANTVLKAKLNPKNRELSITSHGGSK